MRDASVSALACATAPTVVLCRAAMWLTVSPERTVYWSSAWAPVPVAVTATAAIASVVPVPVAARRSPSAREVASGVMVVPRGGSEVTRGAGVNEVTKHERSRGNG
ncbi:hypothetical protein CBZ_10390 [Cellulomonas biazotea]|uniref:Uncharacterized protein n=1 Tax=Cellulomonas biazotea TaxID=1709 RepID=A0A402DPB9_9CELL|nr:hypothetical protein CBZ_10390 [Cellulomonas biazotea]